MMLNFFKRDLNTILSAFHRIEADLHAHLDRKQEEHFNLLADKSELEDRIDDTAQELDRSHRVLAKVQELVA